MQEGLQDYCVRKYTGKDTDSILWGKQPKETRTLTGQGIGDIQNWNKRLIQIEF